MSAQTYRTLDDIAEVVRRFESCDYKPSEFSHACHLTVAAWYLSRATPAEALDCMRTSLQSFTRHYGVHAYHETITRFWMGLAANHLKDCPASQPFPGKVNALVERYGQKNLLFDYYSRDLVMSEAARNGWVAPDLQNFVTDCPSQHGLK